MTARDIGLFAMTLAMSHFLHCIVMQSQASSDPNSAFVAFFLWILGNWLVMISYVIPVFPVGRRIVVQIAELAGMILLGFYMSYLFS
jgi:hypothetical protein